MIGVFDSGNGGLSILHACAERLPDQTLVYLGDHGHAPYGCRPSAEVIDLTRAGVERLFQRGCRLVVLACNTAAAIALRRLQQDWLPTAYPDRRILGILVPMVEAVTGVPWDCETPQPGGRQEPSLIGVFATRRTVASQAYRDEIVKRAPAVQIVQQACPDLVVAMEGHASAATLDAMIQGYVSELLEQTGGQAPNSVILGCTHYQLVAESFRAALPRGVEVHNQPSVVAESLADYLRRHPGFAAPSETPAPADLFTTGPAPVINLRARDYLKGLEYAPLG